MDVFIAVIESSAVCGRVEKADHHFHQAQSHVGMVSNLTCLNTLIRSCSNNHINMPRALSWFRQIAQVGLMPNAVSFRHVIVGLAKFGSFAEFSVWLKKMSSAGFTLDIDAKNEVAEAFIDRGKAKQAEVWLRECGDTSLESNAVLEG